MDGILVINKEKDYTSHDVVAIVKKILHEKVGHTGTLDPNATGVLPLLIGNGTKLSKYLINHDKEYCATLQLGIKTDTADTTGNLIEEREVPILEEAKIREVLQELVGKQKQVPPMYSAIKIQGKKLYEYARQGKTVEIPAREIELYSLKLQEWNGIKKEIVFTVKCSKGTYIRTLCEQIAEKLETIGAMKELSRLQVGEFSIENSIKIEEVKQMVMEPEKIQSHMIQMEEILHNKESIVLEQKELEVFLNGVKLKKEIPNSVVKIYTKEGKFIGSGEIVNEQLKRDVIF